MTKLQIDLPIKTMTSKVSVNAHARLKDLAERHGFLIQDVLSACLLHMPEQELVRILEEHKAAVDALPRAAKAVLKSLDAMTAADREAIKKLL